MTGQTGLKINEDWMCESSSGRWYRCRTGTWYEMAWLMEGLWRGCSTRAVTRIVNVSNGSFEYCDTRRHKLGLGILAIICGILSVVMNLLCSKWREIREPWVYKERADIGTLVFRYHSNSIRRCHSNLSHQPLISPLLQYSCFTRLSPSPASALVKETRCRKRLLTLSPCLSVRYVLCKGFLIRNIL